MGLLDSETCSWPTATANVGKGSEALKARPHVGDPTLTTTDNAIRSQLTLTTQTNFFIVACVTRFSPMYAALALSRSVFPHWLDLNWARKKVGARAAHRRPPEYGEHLKHQFGTCFLRGLPRRRVSDNEGDIAIASTGLPGCLALVSTSPVFCMNLRTDILL